MASAGQIRKLTDTPYEVLDQNGLNWVTTMKQVWNLWKKSPSTTKMLNDFFQACTNPYIAALQIMVNSGDFYLGKQNSLAYHVIETFSSWLEPMKPGVQQYLDRQTKLDAFHLINKQKNHQFMKLVSQVFEMDTDKEIFIPHIKHIIDQKQYKEACQWAVILQLHNHFSIEDFVIPLILQDKFPIADEYLQESPPHQQNIANYLDSLLGKRNIRNEVHCITDEFGIPDVKLDKMYHKPLSKLVARIMKTYNLPPTACPNLCRKRGEGALQFLINKRYVDKNISDESWAEMVLEAVGDDSSLHLELVLGVSILGSVKEAIHWAHQFNVPYNDWPYLLQKYQEEEENKEVTNSNTSNASTSNTIEENWDLPEETDTAIKLSTHALKMDLSNIIVIDDADKFKKMLAYNWKNVHIIGIDSEWKPSFKMIKSGLALLQIATEDVVFIIDVINLNGLSSELWRNFAYEVFENFDIIKLGFNIETDMNMLKSSLPCLSNIRFNGYGYLDLSILWKTLIKEEDFHFPYEDVANENTSESLSKLVELCLGEKLDKCEQFSNWQNRPLRPNQIYYAALDAFCLIEVYNVIRTIAEEIELPFAEMTDEIMLKQGTPKRSKKKKATVPSFQQPTSPFVNSITAPECRVVCDNNLVKLGKNLRKCGVDTIIRKEEDRDEITLAQKKEYSERFIITTHNKYKKFNKLVPAGHIFCMLPNKSGIDQLKDVVDYFKIVVRKEDIFSRCQVCNSNSFLILTQQEMNQLSTQPATVDYTDSEEDEEELVFRKEDKSWKLKTPQVSTLKSGITKYGAKIQINDIQPQALKNIDVFYVCEICGKCFYDGSHIKKVFDGDIGKLVTL